MTLRGSRNFFKEYRPYGVFHTCGFSLAWAHNGLLTFSIWGEPQAPYDVRQGLHELIQQS